MSIWGKRVDGWFSQKQSAATARFSQNQSPDAQSEEPVKSTKWPLYVLLAPVLLLGGCFYWVSEGGDGESDSNGAEAEYYCEEFVKDRLKAPSTAVFDLQASSDSGPTYTVSGTVESQNSFGGMVLNDVSCVVRDTGGEWVLEDMSGPAN